VNLEVSETSGSVDGQDYVLELPMHLWGRELKRVDPMLLREFEDPERRLTCEVLDLVPAWFEFPAHEGGHQAVRWGGGTGVGRLIRSSGYLLRFYVHPQHLSHFRWIRNE